MKKLHLEVLNKKQKEVLPQLSFLKNFYLAGGTALALQIGHRTSVDFDFYTPKHFDAKKLYQEIEKVFGSRVVKTGDAEDTLFGTINEVSVSFFWYKHKLIKKPKKIMGVRVACMEDVAAMKLIAISYRPKERDYIDIYYLLKTLPLKEMFSLVSKKYPNFNQYYTIRALGYFDDIKEEDKRPIKVFDPEFSWEAAKKKIFEEVKRFQLSMIKK